MSTKNEIMIPLQADMLALWREIVVCQNSFAQKVKCRFADLAVVCRTPPKPGREMKTRADIPQASVGRLLTGIAVALAAFIALGTLAALWKNPFFIRMTPAGGWEIGLLALLALLSGVYVAIRRPYCSNRTVGVGSVLGFLGIACPVCNKILLVVFGGELLLTYFEPIWIYVAALGVAVAIWAVVHEWRNWKIVPANPSFSP